MATEVVMPQMGESIAEGTIVRWIKKVGDTVDRDEPLFEISTDKVDAEIPSPAAGVVSEIRVKEGETVPVNSVVAVIGGAAPAAAKDAAKTPEAPAAKAPEPPNAAPQADGSPTATAPPKEQAPTSARNDRAGAAAGKPAAEGGHYHAREELPPPPKAPASAPDDGARATARQAEPRAAERKPTSSAEEAIRERSSPLVRKIAKEHDVDISQIRGSGIAGRVTKDDILAFIGEGGARREGGKAEEKAERLEGAKAERAEGQKVERVEGKAGGVSGAPVPPPPKFAPGESDHVEKMSPMRKRIAEHMVVSRRTSAHVHSVFEVNFSRIAKIREAKKSDFERAGVKVTYLSFIFKAVVDALRAVPIVNASVDGENIVYHKEINLGIAVALDWGLIVPVVKHADEKNLVGISRAVADLANRARSKQLKPEEVAGGTFTITNPGVFGALFGTPIINQPQVAILGVGNVEKRPVVVDDAIAIRPMAYLTLGYDHRIVDGAVADEFMSIVKKTLENWEPTAV
jgi:pyruvate dehydrogenase E2 component (dihydrolipoyllysine-residue acetyltransferase)